MKKIALLFLLFTSATAMYGQVKEENAYTVPVYSIHEPHFGITAGIQGNSFYNTESAEADFRVGYHIGFSYSMPLSKRVSFEPQLLYTKKGAEIDYLYDPYDYRSVNYKLHYLELPLKWNIHTKSIVDFVVGAYGSYLLDANYDVETAYLYGEGELDYSQFNKFDVGLIGGVAFNFPFSKLSITYSHGLSDVPDNSVDYAQLNGARNQTLSVSLAFYLR